MAAHLKSLNLPQGASIAMLAKNSAHFFMAELAIWMAGGTTVAVFPTETADNVGYVLRHGEARLLFIGKLDTWELQKSGIRRPALHRAAAGARRGLRDLGRHRRAHAAAAGPLAARRRRPGDAAVHLGLHRPAQGRDAELWQHHGSDQRHPRQHA